MSTKKSTEVVLEEISTEQLNISILGVTPIILNRMSQKVISELWLPKGKKTAADKAANLKHNPYEEFRNSPYTFEDDNAPTLLGHLATAFKGAIAGAALDMPGASKSQMGRLMFVEGELIPLWGIPKLHVAITRSADMNKTPDVRTRCCIPKWATRITVTYAVPILREKIVMNLLAAAGMIQGIGDWRPGKGKGNYGQFRIVSPDDQEYMNIIQNGGRQVQKDAMVNPVPYDLETQKILAQFFDEAERRGIKGVMVA